MSESIAEITPRTAAVGNDAGLARDYVLLLKPRVMSLVVFTGLVGLALAPGEIDPVTAAVAVLCIAAGAGAAGAINMWYDRDVDAVMTRTRSRPLPTGRVRPAEALYLGVALGVVSVLLMAFLVGWMAAALLAFTIGFYVFVYTIWLKRRTPQNIVVGGAAGALPPVIGWAAVTGEVGLGAVALFSIIFFWTPAHFWALALYRSGDYARAGIPMLPVVAGTEETSRQIVVYTVVAAAIGVMPWLIGLSGALYGLASLVLGGAFLYHALRVYRDRGEMRARRMFGFSILYLFLIFCFLLVDRAAAHMGWI